MTWLGEAETPKLSTRYPVSLFSLEIDYIIFLEPCTDKSSQRDVSRLHWLIFLGRSFCLFVPCPLASFCLELPLDGWSCYSHSVTLRMKFICI